MGLCALLFIALLFISANAACPSCQIISDQYGTKCCGGVGDLQESAGAKETRGWGAVLPGIPMGIPTHESLTQWGTLLKGSADGKCWLLHKCETMSSYKPGFANLDHGEWTKLERNCEDQKGNKVVCPGKHYGKRKAAVCFAQKVARTPPPAQPLITRM